MRWRRLHHEGALRQAPLQTAYRLGEQLLRLAHAQSESALIMLAQYMLGMVLFQWGELASSHTHHAQALALYVPQAHRPLASHYGIDLGVGSGSFVSWELWLLGYPGHTAQPGSVHLGPGSVTPL